MKKFKRILSMVTAVATMVGCLTIGTHAKVTSAENEYPVMTGSSSLTVKSTKQNRDFELYQIFYGDYEEANDGSKNLTELQWGVSLKKQTDADSTYDYTGDLITALKQDKLADGTDNPFATAAKALGNDVTVDDVASLLKGATNNSEEADAFAAIVSNVLSDKTVDTAKNPEASTVTLGTRTSYHYKFSNIHSGYYLINDVTTAANVAGSAYSKFILKVAGPTETETKISSVPTLDKQIKKADGTFDDDINVALGDDVEFQLSSAVPDMSGYTKYFFIVKDEMCEGLTFKEIKSVTIGDTVIPEKSEATDEKYYTYEEEPITDDDGNVTGTSLKIVFHNFIQYKDLQDEDIKINYLATLNQFANFGEEGNLNRAQLNYTNNPNFNYNGEDEPAPGDPDDPDNPDNPKNDMAHTGTTSWVNAYVFSTGLNVIKVDGDGNRLAGAKFKIVGDTLNSVYTKSVSYTAVGVYGEVAESEDAKYYYKLTDGAMDENAPESDDDDNYMQEYVMYTDNTGDSTAVTGKFYHNLDTGVYEEERDEESDYEKAILVYVQEDEVEDVIEKSDNVVYEAEVGSNGLLVLQGLSAGTYQLYETEAPKGYNKLTEPITVVISYTAPAQGSPSKCTWKFKTTDPNNNNAVSEKNGVNGIGEVSVQNLLGTTLPSTGGIGTRIFYTAGSILLLGAVILLVSKRRMRNEAM
jgi:fimbrial isopeptide formation D2 family protein/LPXTG-motif cell wall-anchored protein